MLTEWDWYTRGFIRCALLDLLDQCSLWAICSRCLDDFFEPNEVFH